MRTHLKPLAALLPLAFVSDLHAQQLLDPVVVTSTRFESEQQQQPIAVIVETIEGNSVFKECGLGLSKCSETHPCPIHNDYKVAREMIEKIFNEKNESLSRYVIYQLSGGSAIAG